MYRLIQSRTVSDDCSVLTDPNCNKSVSSSTYSLPIALALIIPITIVVCTLIYLHRRHVRKQRQEDAHDRHASLDFGLGEVHRTKTTEKQNYEVTETEFGSEKRPRQLSMDMMSPYVLPPELNQSQETLRSLSRTTDNREDPYRPVTQYLADPTRKVGHDGASIYTMSSGPSNLRDVSVPPAARLPMSDASSVQGDFPAPPRMNSLAASDRSDPFHSHFDSPATSIREFPTNVSAVPHVQMPEPAAMSLPRIEIGSSDGPTTRNDNVHLEMPAMPAEQQYTAEMPAQHSFATEMPAAPVSSRKPLTVMTDAHEAMIENTDGHRAGSNYGLNHHVTPPSPHHNGAPAQRYSMDVPPEEFASAGLGAPGFDAKRLSMGFRPLPPDSLTVDVEDPEMRANRIRSFYKEYFDESKPAPKGQYIDDYEEDYAGQAAHYDPRANSHVMPFAEPIVRRAMTPPPRLQGYGGPPRAPFMGGQSRSRSSSRSRQGSLAGPRAPFMGDGSRPHSSASNRGGPRSQSSASQQPRGRPLPPPADLTTLPTPSKLRDDSFALFAAADFAPPTTYRDRQYGRSESPLGERRAYSPAVPAFQPLVSSFMDIAPLPSPHSLRKSGTFTSLDFAPPRKFARDDGSGSDAGSIRSTRSGVSQLQNEAIRKGAYRVSRLPPDAVPTKDHMNNILKPSWGMRPGEGASM